MKLFRSILLHTIFFTVLFSQAQDDVELVEFATGLNSPAAITHAGDDRLFVVEKAGYIRIIDTEGNLKPEPFLDITDRADPAGNEQGLLGLAFHPNYGNNGYFFVNYTDDQDQSHIARFSVNDGNPDLADPDSEFTILTLDQPFTNHNGGDLVFGPDGYLYIGFGDGGSGGDPGNRSQNLSVLLGKMLRIDVDSGNPYAIPEDNPFVDNPDALDEIWAYGLRNPWRFSFDRETGDLWIADVGQNQIEEIDFQPASSDGGENYGWRCYEGNSTYNTSGCGPQSDYVFPVFEYTHNNGCSVTGGYVYRGTDIPQMEGYYVFADYCTDYIWTLHEEGGEWISNQLGQFSGNNFSTFGEDANGELYVAGYSNGTIFRFKSTTSGFNDVNPQPLQIYPNPFNDKIRIGTKSVISQPVRIIITDLHGNDVFQSDLNREDTVLNLGFLSAGVYIVGLKDQNGISIYEKLCKR